MHRARSARRPRSARSPSVFWAKGASPTIHREYAVGRGRIDLLVIWPGVERGDPPATRWAIELKVWRDGAADPEPAGRDQLADYLDRLGLESGTLLIFDGRSAGSISDRSADDLVEHRGHRLRVVRL